MEIDFEKWHGCKNDFIVVWLKSTDDLLLESLKRQSTKLCSRRGEGLGADGILVLQYRDHQENYPSRLHIINSDGSIAQNCGNGLRCAAQSVLKYALKESHQYDIPELVTFEVAGKELICRFLHQGKLRPEMRQFPFVAVDLGVPTLNAACENYPQVKKAFELMIAKTDLEKLNQDFSVVELGNPHIVITVAPEELHLIEQIGPAMQQVIEWDGINVHLVADSEVSEKDLTESANRLGSQIEELYTATTWERGAGRTQACGTGACAIIATQLSSGLSSRASWHGVSMPGGRLYAKQENETDPMTLAGPTEFVAHGKLIV